MKVHIIDKPHNGIWGSDAVVSIAGSEAVVHIPSGCDPVRQCRKAAVRLSTLGFNEADLTGELWTDELMYAFWQGFFDARRRHKVRLPAHSGELDDLIRVMTWVRETVNLPPSELYPETLIDATEKFLLSLKGTRSVTAGSYFGDELRIHNYVGTHTVGRGSAREPGVLTVDYNPTGSSSVDLCLVAKGITFDSGGYSLKTGDYMQTMKADMAGAAVAAGALGLMILKGMNLHVRLVICAAENLVSGAAYKVDDIVRFPNDVTVEIRNTDAEGRLVLADGLLKAASCSPSLIIDCATLTGAAKVALGREYNAALSFDEKLSFGFREAAGAVHEGAWPLPLTEDHAAEIRSDVADIANSAAGEKYAGASTAAAFLSRFVPRSIPWIHLDLAASYQKSQGAEFLTGAKGVGVRSIVSFVERNMDELRKVRLSH